MATLLAASALPRLSWADAGNPAYLAAAQEPDGAFALFGLGTDGAARFRIPLPDRGHAAAAHPHAPEAVAFARRPGTFALVINCAEGRVSHWLEALEGRHFYGHGTFIEGGDILATTENDIATGEGRIGLWSRGRGYARIGEIASGGTGPHEVLALPDDTLVVANGGIRTHPKHGREKLNLDTMRPNLAYVAPTGEILEQVALAPDLARNSIRHLARAGDQVAFAMQWQGDPSAAVPLLGLHHRGETPILAEADLAEQIALQGYAGSVAFDGSGTRVAITSPRGGRVHVFGTDGQFIRSLRRADVCGVAQGAKGFAVTDGLGGVARLDGDALRPQAQHARSWDNHLVSV